MSLENYFAKHSFKIKLQPEVSRGPSLCKIHHPRRRWSCQGKPIGRSRSKCICRQIGLQDKPEKNVHRISIIIP